MTFIHLEVAIQAISVRLLVQCYNVRHNFLLLHVDRYIIKHLCFETASLRHRTNPRDKIRVYGLCDGALFAVPYNCA